MNTKILKIFSQNRGLSLVEVVVAISIVSIAFLPIFSLFSNNTKRQYQLVNLTYATYIAKRIIEKSIQSVQSSGSFDSIETDSYFALLADSKYPLSKLFKDFDVSGINQDSYPTLKRELKNYFFNLSLHDVKEMEKNPNIKRLEVSVFYENIYNEKKGKVILNILLSRYKQ
ncbi:type II secretion system GspH family protein [bacterium]|nr:type II secretion system GspH family protein [bacterium]